MDATNLPPKGESRTLKDHPQYYGVYLNMARHNAYLIYNHTNAQANKQLEKAPKPLANDDELKNAVFFHDGAEQKEGTGRLLELMPRYLPISKLFHPERLPAIERSNQAIDLNAACVQFQHIFRLLHRMRNECSHYYHATRETKRDFKVDEAFGDWYRAAYVRAVEYTRQRFHDVFNQPNDFDLAEKLGDELLVNYELQYRGVVFFACWFLTREQAFHFINRMVGFKGTTARQQLAAREVFMAYCAKLPAAKLVSTDKRQALELDLLNELSRCPTPLFDALPPEKQQLFRPSAEALAKARPNVEANSLPESLDEEDYQEYVSQLSTRRRVTDRFATLALRWLEEKGAFKKYAFQLRIGKYQLASYLKKLDAQEYPRSVTENVCVFGKLSSYEIEDTEGRLSAQDELEANMATWLTREGRAVPAECGFQQYSPRYNIKQNKIAIQYIHHHNKLSNDLSGSEPPAGHIPSDFPYPLLLPSTGKIGLRLYQPQPSAFISIHILPQLVLAELMEPGLAEKMIESYLNQQAPKLLNLAAIEQIKATIQGCEKPLFRRTNGKEGCDHNSRYQTELRRRKALLDKALKPYHLTALQVPTRIVDYVLNITDTRQERAISEAIKKQRAEVAQRLRAFKKRPVPAGMEPANNQHYNNRLPKVGEVASWLARDMVRMMTDSKAKEAFTTFYYDQLQKSLALWPNPELGAPLFNRVLGQGFSTGTGKPCHPFIHRIRIDKYHKLKDFYRAYLREKQEWIERTFYDVQQKDGRKHTDVKLPQSTQGIPVKMQRLVKPKSDLADWLANIGQTNTRRPRVLEVPATLFAAKVEQLLRTRLASADKPAEASDKFARLLAKVANLEAQAPNKPNLQPFYLYNRSYQVYGHTVPYSVTASSYEELFAANRNGIQAGLVAENNARKKQRLPKLSITDAKKKFKKRVVTNEKHIRHFQTQDRVLWMMYNQLAEHTASQPLSLENLDPDKELSPLSDQVKMRQLLTGTLHIDAEGHGKKQGRNVPISREVVATRKRKDFGLLRTLQHDRRLPELFEFTPEKQEVEYETIRLALDAYRRCREKAMDAVFDLEKALIAHHKEALLHAHDKKAEPTEHILFNTYLDVLEDQELANPAEIVLLRGVRNAFAHNHFVPQIVLPQSTQQLPVTEVPYVALELLTATIKNIVARLNESQIA